MAVFNWYYLVFRFCTNVLVTKYSQTANKLCKKVNNYMDVCYGISDWKELLPIDKRGIWPPKYSAALLRELGDLIFYPAFITTPELLGKCILASYEIRAGIREVADPQWDIEFDQLEHDVDGAEWEFYSLLKAVEHVTRDSPVLSHAPYIHHTDLQNVVKAWDCWVREGLVKFPTTSKLKHGIQSYQRQIDGGMAYYKPLYLQSDWFTPKDFVSKPKEFQDCILKLHAYNRYHWKLYWRDIGR